MRTTPRAVRPLALILLASLPCLEAPVAQCGLEQLAPAVPGGVLQLGVAVGIDGERMLISGRTSEQLGFLQAYERTPAGWAMHQVLWYPDQGSKFYFGSGPLDVSGGTAVVAATGDSSSGVNAGSVFVFELVAGSWTQAAKLQPSNPISWGYYGISVDVEGDTILVGAPSHGVGGVVEVHQRVAGVWTLVQTLQSSDIAAQDSFGHALSRSGNRVLVSAPGDDVPGTNSGAAYVFEHNGAQWAQTAKLEPTSGFSYAAFGRACALDGDRALISDFSKRAYFFEKSGPAWVQKKFFVGPQADHVFGQSVALQADVALIGSPIDLEVSLGGKGAVHVYDRSGDTWKQRDVLSSCGSIAHDSFGVRVAIDQETALIADSTQPAAPGQNGLVTVYGSPAGAAALSCPLSACWSYLSTAQGGEQRFWLNAGLGHAGKLALLLSSLSGTAPGLAVDGWNLPLNPDALFSFTLANPNTAPFAQTFGILPAGATLHPKLVLHPGAAVALAGMTMSSAYAVIDPATLAVAMTSNAARTDLAP